MTPIPDEATKPDIEAPIAQSNAPDAPETPAPAPHTSPSWGEKKSEPDAFDALIDEYERLTGTASKPDAPDANGEDPADVLRTAEADYARDQAQRAADNEARSRFDQMADAIQMLAQDRIQQQEKADFENVVKRANNEYLAGLPVPADFAERWLLAEAQLDPVLNEAWQRRYESPEKQYRAERQVEKALHRMRNAAAAIPDKEITEDVRSVAWAVRGGSRQATEAPPKNYANMSNPEFRKELEDMGITPSI